MSDKKSLNGNNILIPKRITHSQSQYNINDMNNQTKPIKMSRSYTFDNIIIKETNWPEDIKKYDYNKKYLQWGFNQKPKIVKEKYVKSLDLYFNPITQKYKDIEFDKELKKYEEKELKNKIAVNYDKELRVIQTYDIINLQDRLKGFENHPDYPVIKSMNPKNKKNNSLSTKQNYNILSNINLSQHHYDKPENRPIDNEKDKEKDNIKNREGKYMKRINLKQYKDYNILSNKYKRFDKEKKDVDTQMKIVESSKKYFQTRDYDAIKGVYVDEEKEKNYQEERKNKLEELKYIKRDSVFNPFNNQIFDKQKFDEENQRLANKIYRYSLRPEIENFHHQQDLRKYSAKNDTLRTKLIYQRFKPIDKRGYDIISGKDKFNFYKNSLRCRSIQKPWEMIKNGVNDNETISTKKLFLCYDKDDINQRYSENKNIRENILRNLPKIENENIFQIKKYPSKINLSYIKNNSLENNNRYENQDNHLHSFILDKKFWFSNDKNNNYLKN